MRHRIWFGKSDWSSLYQAANLIDLLFIIRHIWLMFFLWIRVPDWSMFFAGIGNPMNFRSSIKFDGDVIVFLFLFQNYFDKSFDCFPRTKNSFFRWTKINIESAWLSHFFPFKNFEKKFWSKNLKQKFEKKFWSKIVEKSCEKKTLKLNCDNYSENRP